MEALALLCALSIAAPDAGCADGVCRLPVVGAVQAMGRGAAVVAVAPIKAAARLGHAVGERKPLRRLLARAPVRTRVVEAARRVVKRR